MTLAPPDADGLAWYDGMAKHNIDEYKKAEEGADRLAEYLEPSAQGIRQDPTRLIQSFFHELPASDRRIVANAVIRAKLSDGYAAALKDSIWGWVDDSVAYRANWGFDPADITVPIRLWHGANDVFSPVRHTEWLAERIVSSEAVIQPGAGHFAAIDTLPGILLWLTGADASIR